MIDPPRVVPGGFFVPGDKGKRAEKGPSSGGKRKVNVVHEWVGSRDSCIFKE